MNDDPSSNDPAITQIANALAPLAEIVTACNALGCDGESCVADGLLLILARHVINDTPAGSTENDAAMTILAAIQRQDDAPDPAPTRPEDSGDLPPGLVGRLYRVTQTGASLVKTWTYAGETSAAIMCCEGDPGMVLVFAVTDRRALDYGRAWLGGERDDLVERTWEHRGLTIAYVDDIIPF